MFYRFAYLELVVSPLIRSSKALHPASALYLKNGFVDIPRYNDNYRADVFMERRLT